MHYGIISIIPVLLVFVIAFKTKKTFESLFIGSIAGFLILDKQKFLESWLETLLNVLANETVLWVIIVTFFFGAMINLFEKTGALNCFANFTENYAKSSKDSLVIAWFISLLFFIDDYLHNLVIGSAMKKVTDKHKISRAKLAYLTNSTAGNLASLVPISTWAVFYAGLMSENGLSVADSGMKGYIKTIPYQFYPIVAIIISFLVAIFTLPDLGAMKKSELMSKDKEQLKNSEKKEEQISIWYFFIPIIVLIIVTIVTEINVLNGILGALISIGITMIPTKKVKAGEYMEIVMEGFANMIPIACILGIAFTLMEANTRLGLADFIIETVQPFMSGACLPVVVFLTAVVFAYFTGMFWDMAAILFPITIPLAIGVGANPYLVAATIFSASSWGSQVCMYGDAVVINAGACEISPTEHSITTLPYGLLGVGISAILYFIMGFII